MSTLSGYLNKLSVSSLNGSTKANKRYFVCNDSVNALNGCKLYYYRNSLECNANGVPLGHIDISTATFNTSSNTSNIFTIISFNKQITLEAKDHNECVQWLTKLQALRRNYMLRETNQNKGIDCCGAVTNSNTNNQSLYQTVSNSTSTSNQFTSSPSPSPSASKRIFNKIGIISRIGSISNASKQHNYDQNNCLKCAEREDDLSAIQNELQASREVIKLLQQQLEIANNEKKLLQDICNTKSQIVSTDYLKYITDINEQITKLEIDLREKQLKCCTIENDLDSVNAHNIKLKDEINVLQEMLQSRDESVIQLTHQIFDLETQTKCPQKLETNNLTNLELNELENLRDSVKAIVAQNEFLNREIVELNELRNTTELRERESQTKICELEAKCCQIQSKLLSLLKEIKQSNEAITNSNDNKLIASNESVLTLVNRLMDENSLDIPLSWRPGNKSRNSSIVSTKDISYDDLGFYYKHSNDNLDFIITNVDKVKISNELLNDKRTQNEHKLYMSWKLKWDAFVGNVNSHSLQRTQELKAMLRSGIPQQYRCKIWKALIYMRIKDKFNDKPINYYQSLLKHNGVQQEANCDPSIKQIELDLLRTLPHNKHFDSLESDGTCRLRRVLTAYSRHNQVVGYCQGLNRLAAVALLFMPEEDAFWCLVAIVETIMPPHYFGRNLLGAHVDQYVLRHLMAEKLARLHYHLDVNQIELSLFSWFLTVFVDNIPVEVYLRIWDVFLYEGSKVLFRFALSLMKMHEQQLLQMTDSVSVNQFLRTLGERQCDLNQLSNIAFHELNPFPYRTVKLKRQYYYNLVKSDLEKLELIRQNLPNHDTSFDCESD